MALALGLVAFATAPLARADILPPPQRPTWDQEPQPLPRPPPERELERAALAVLAGLTLLSAVCAAMRLRAGRARAESRA